MPDLDPAGAQDADCTVVAIGASAGGVVALQALFQSIPPDLNLAFVVVQHFPPGERTRLPMLLGSWSPMPVYEATDGVRPQPGCIYVAMPYDVLTLERGVFRMRPVEGGSRRPGIDTIDALFESIAADRGARAIAIVLSGTGMDGASGAVCIRQRGGLVFVQEPLTALHVGMPTAVITRGVADEILPVWQIARCLCSCSAGEYERPRVAAETSDVTSALDSIFDLIRRQAGFDLSGYKPSPVLWRIQQRMDARQIKVFADYESLLRDEPAELESLIRGIPIHVTEFFRDPEAWDDLRDLVVRPLAQTADEGTIRAWTPGCATGEEAYSVAMLLHEHGERSTFPVDFQVFATDASPEVLARASRGIFSDRALRGISRERKRFFYGVDGSWRVQRNLREKMVFATHDLLADPPFANLDLVTCRNLLIYLNPDAIQRVLFLLHGSLREGGFLFLGRGESLSPRQHGFEPVSFRSHIYRKTGPLDEIAVRLPTRIETSDETTLSAHTHFALRERLDLPAVLIDGDFRILRVYGDTTQILRLPAGEPSSNLLELAQRDLVPHLQEAARDALADHRSVTVTGLRDRELGEDALAMRLTPLHTGDVGATPRILVSFQRGPDGWGGDSGHSRSPYTRSDPPGWSDAIRISHEELEASREELQSLNEELLSSNELLNTSNESLNEANARLRSKVAELELQSRVLSSGSIMTLFLDDDLRIRWFTPSMSELLPLRAGDVGRLITDLAPRFSDRGFLDDVAAVMRHENAVDAEIRSEAGRWYLRRIRPFRTVAGGPAGAGVAITFTDIDAIKLAERMRHEHEERQALLLRLSDALRPLRDDRSILTEACRAMREHFGATCMLFLEPADPDELEVVAEARLPEVPSRLTSRCRADDLTAFVLLPLEREGKVAVLLAAQRPEPGDWSAVESALLEDVGERTWIAVERARVERSLRESEAWLSGQKEAFQAAVNGASLEESLGILVRIAIEQMEDTTRCGFYLVDASGREGRPGDGWSFPVETSEGKFVGSFVIDHPAPRSATRRDVELAEVITRAAGIIISRHHEAEERARIARVLQESETRLRALVDAFTSDDAMLRDRWVGARTLLDGISQAFWETDADGVATGDSPKWVDAIHPDEREVAASQWREAVATHKTVDSEFRSCTADGSYRWTNVRAVPLIGSNGAVEKWFGMNIDIDSRKRAELARSANAGQ